jgi:putative MFS transporter
VSALAHFHATGVFVGAAVLIGILCLDVALLGPLSTGMSLEHSSAPST